MAQVKITELPQALALTGAESVPIVQNGVTVQTTTGAISGAGALNYPFLTVGQTAGLSDSRYLSTNSGLSLTDNGAQSTLQINLIGAAMSLNSSSTGIQVKTGSNTVTARSLAVGAGLGITNDDGVSGDPTISLGSFLSNIQSLSASTGLVAVDNGVASSVQIDGTSGNIAVANGNGDGGNPTINLIATGVTSGSYGSTGVIPVITVDSFGRITSVTTAQSAAGGTVTEIDTGVGLLGGPITTSGTIEIDTTVVATLSGSQMLTNKTISGSSNTLTNIGNASLTNSTISGVALGSNLNALTIGTGLSGTSYNGSSAVTISLQDTAVTAGTYGSSSAVGVFTVDAQGRLTFAGNTIISPSGIGAISEVNGTTNQIDSSTVDGVVTLSISDEPVLVGPVKVLGIGSTSITPFSNTMQVWEADDNNFQVVYVRNVNNGSDASADFVAYNDASDASSYFIDMGMNSSNYTSVTYPIFTPNSGYVFTGGGASGQQSDLFIGTSNPDSDIIFFVGGVDPSNQCAMFSGATGNLLLGTDTDTGYLLNVNGTSYLGGAATFGSTVLLNANPTLALEAATKAYVDSQVTAGLHIHDPVRVETTANLTATYTQGGTTFNITDITGGNTVTTSTAHGLSVNDQIWLYTSAGNGLSTNTAYFVYSVPASNQLTLSLTFGGPQVTGLTNATGLTYATRANSGIGATLTNAGVQTALSIDGVSLSVGNRVMVRLQTNGEENGVYTVTTVGSGATNWVLTRASDASFVSPSNPNGLGTGDYFFTQEGLLNAGDSHVLTTEPNTMIIGYTPLTYTQFSGSVDYVGGTNITIVGQTINVSGTIASTLGGTGTSTVAVGDLLYGSATDTWSKLALGSAYKSLIVNASGTQVEWNAIALNQSSAVSGQLGAGNGGTGLSSYTSGDIIYASGSTTLSKLALGTAGYVMVAGASAPEYVAQSTLTVGTATNTTITANSTNADYYLTFVSATTGNLPQLVNSSITCNPSTGKLTGGIAGGSF